MGPAGHYRPYIQYSPQLRIVQPICQNPQFCIFCTFFFLMRENIGLLLVSLSVCEFSLSMPVSQGGQYISFFPHYPTYINMSGEGQGVGRGRGRRGFIFLALCFFYILGGNNTLLNIISERSTFRKYKIKDMLQHR